MKEKIVQLIDENRTDDLKSLLDGMTLEDLAAVLDQLDGERLTKLFRCLDNEIAADVDADPRAAYFRQTLNGKLMRMALIMKLLAEKDAPAAPAKRTVPGAKCKNPKCVTHLEDLPALYLEEDGERRCVYCETFLKEGRQGR